MNSLTFDLRCPKCGNELTLDAQSKPGGTTHTAVLRCITSSRHKCGLRWLLKMEMFVASMSAEGDANRCGTALGYRDHLRDGTDPCDDCAIAHLHKGSDRGALERQRRRDKKVTQ
jgi:hypothetical protein